MRWKSFVALVVRGTAVWLLASRALRMLAIENAKQAPDGAMVGAATACFMLAGLIAVPPFIRLFGGQLGGFIGGSFFYPEGRFQAPPPELIGRLRMMVHDGQLGTAEQQLRALLRSYPPCTEVYHLLARALAQRGESPTRVLAEAKAKLWPHQRAELFRLLQRDPLPSPQETEWKESAHLPGFYERITETPPPERPAPLRFTPAPAESNEAPGANSAPDLKLKLTRSHPPEQPPGVAGE